MGKPGVRQFMGLQSVRHNLVSEYTHKSSSPLHCLVPLPESSSHPLILQISVQIQPFPRGFPPVM